MKAIEATGILSKRGIIKLDKPVKIKNDIKVKIIILRYESSDINEKDWLKSISGNPAFDFLKDKKEDIYTVNDGKSHYGKK